MGSKVGEKKPIKSSSERTGNAFFWVVMAGIVLLGLILIGLGVAKLAIGIIYIQDCELQPLLPVYLIVDFGVGLLFFIFVLAFVFIVNKQDSPATDGCGAILCLLFSLIPLFLVAWMIVGTVWVMNLREEIYSPEHCLNSATATPFEITPRGNFTTNEDNRSTISFITFSNLSSNSTTQRALRTLPGDTAKCLTCHEILVNFTFGVVIAQWVVFGIGVLGGLFAVLYFAGILWLCARVGG